MKYQSFLLYSHVTLGKIGYSYIISDYKKNVGKIFLIFLSKILVTTGNKTISIIQL